jgi:hypothetical protein
MATGDHGLLRIEGDGALKPLGAGLVAMDVMATFDDPSSPYWAQLEVSVVGRTLTCTGASFRTRPGGVPVGSAELRKVKIRELMAVVRGELFGAPNAVVWKERQRTDSAISYTMASAIELQESSSTRRPITPDRLTEVARVYRDALADGRHPTQAVADELHISDAYARKLVSRARDEGSLGPALGRGRAGEIDANRTEMR